MLEEPWRTRMDTYSSSSIHIWTHIAPLACCCIALQRTHMEQHPSQLLYVSTLLYSSCMSILLHMCPHTTICLSSYYYTRVLILLYMCLLYTAICVVILLYMCLHTPIYVSTLYCYICVVILLYICPHTSMYLSSYYYIRKVIHMSALQMLKLYNNYITICVLILLYMCPRTTIYVR